MPRVTAGDVDLYYESLGEGTPFVLQGHDHTAWLFGQAPVFSQRYRVLLYDRRGTGRSSSPDGDWSAADLAGDLENFLDALAIERAIVGGSSLGGVVTAQFGVDYPRTRARADHRAHRPLPRRRRSRVARATGRRCARSAGR